MFNKRSRTTKNWILALAALCLLLQGLACGGTPAAPAATSVPEAQGTPPAESAPTAEATELAEPTLEPTEPPTAPPVSAPGGIACLGSFDFGMTCLGEAGWQSFTEANSSLGDDMIFDMAVCPDDRILIAHNFGISAFDGESWSEYEQGWGVSSPDGIVCDADGGIWVAHFRGVSHFDGAGWTTHSSELLATGAAATDLVEDVAVALDGQVWVTTANSIATFDGSEWTVFQQGDGYDERYFFAGIVVDGQGRPWAAHDGGLLMHDGTAWTAYDNSDLITVESLAIDPEGHVWVGTFNQGVSVFDGQSWVTYDTDTGELSSDHVRSIAIDAQGRVWLGTAWGVDVFDGASWQSYHMHTADLVDNDIYGLAVVGAGPALPAPLSKEAGSISGQIRREDGPVSDATVEICVEDPGLFFSKTPCSGQPLVLQATTDADGAFTIADVPPGLYVVTVLDPSDGQWAQLSGELSFITQRVPVEPGQETDLGQLTLTKE
jgi:sugar lactone lactonase YvrE